MAGTSRPFTDGERVRFHSLLRMAAESPFPGERANALAAATRLAQRAGMSLDEAAAGDTNSGRQQPPPRNQAAQPPVSPLHAELARQFLMLDQQIIADKARRDTALRAAIDRGLDWEERPRRPPRAAAAHHVSDRRMDGHRHARVLLSETSLPLREVSAITGLDIYEVVGMKLKMRAP